MDPVTARVSIMAVAVSRYDSANLPELPGPQVDVERLRELLVENPATALYKPGQFIELSNPTIQQFRETLMTYSTSRTASGDILIFYYSGHGVPVGSDDFGFCASDTRFHPISETVEPLSIIKYSDLLRTISNANVIPIVIIDACYSGNASKTLTIPPIDVIDAMQKRTVTQAAGKYALFCSCSGLQATQDTPDGGVFSHYLVVHASRGMTREELDEPVLFIEDLYPRVDESVMNYSPDATPRLYWGHQLPDIPFVKNALYAPLEYSLEKFYFCILKALWNNGAERELRPREIDPLCGKGAYGNHTKLSYTPWALVETIWGPKRRRLTEKGRRFVKGEISVPQRIIYDPQLNDYVASPGSPMIDIHAVD